MSHIIVIGAGITGVTAAYALQDEGHQVTVIDREGYPAMRTSYANGGQLSASNAAVWNSWDNIRHGLAWMLKADAPLLVGPMPSWHKLSWLAEFVANVRHYRAHTLATTRLALTARRRLFAIAEHEQIEFDLERRGILHVYYDRASLAQARVTNRLLVEGGLERFEVTPLQVQALEPALGIAVYGGFYTPADATGDIHKFCRGLMRACERRGAAVSFDQRVTEFTHHGRSHLVHCQSLKSGERSVLRADGIVVCAGVESRALAAQLGDRINIYPVKGYSITVQLDAASRILAPRVSLLDDAAKIVSSRLGEDRLRVAGTAEFNGFNRDIRIARIEPLLQWTRTLCPQLELSSVISWAGLRPMTPSLMPHVARGRRPGIYYHTGHGHLGWTLSAATADVIAQIVTEDSRQT